MSAQDSLFDAEGGDERSPAPSPDAPLADRLRPQRLDQVIGQRHLLGPGRPLRVAFESGRLHSMILWGPPGVGKTTLARLVANMVDAQFIVLSAVLSGVKEIREAVMCACRAVPGAPLSCLSTRCTLQQGRGMPSSCTSSRGCSRSSVHTENRRSSQPALPSRATVQRRRLARRPKGATRGKRC
jgi:hypothetical protein